MPALTRAVVVQRARSVVNTGKYVLGKGGMKPDSASPLNTAGESDCSGFAAWAVGLSRHQPNNVFYKALNGGWLETTAMTADGLRPGGLFEKVTVPEAGDLICYGDRKVKTAEGKLKTVQGHVGVISEVVNGKVTRVIHCSSGNYRRMKKAIQETSPEVFYNNGAIYLRRSA